MIKINIIFTLALDLDQNRGIFFVAKNLSALVFKYKSALGPGHYDIKPTFADVPNYLI